MDMILADSELKGLRPDPAWDVAGVRDMVGGVIAVALVLCVGVIDRKSTRLNSSHRL